MTANERNTACSCGIFTCQRDDGGGPAGGRPGRGGRLGHSASLRAELGVRGGR